MGYRRDLEIEDLTRPLKEHKSSYLGEKISTAWEAELKRVSKLKANCSKRISDKDENEKEGKNKKKNKGPQPSLYRVLIKVFGLKIMLYGIVLAIMEIALR